jgi:hypothetical protein
VVVLGRATAALLRSRGSRGALGKGAPVRLDGDRDVLARMLETDRVVHPAPHALTEMVLDKHVVETHRWIVAIEADLDRAGAFLPEAEARVDPPS